MKYKLYWESMFPDLSTFIWFKVGNRNDAEDILQEVAYISYRKHKDIKFSSLEDCRKWTFSTAKNVIKKYYKTKRRHFNQEIPIEQSYLESIPDFSESAIEYIIQQEDVNELFSALEKLDIEERYILKWRYDLNLSFKEIAAKTGVNEAALRKRVQRLIQKLKKILKIIQNLCHIRFRAGMK